MITQDQRKGRERDCLWVEDEEMAVDLDMGDGCLTLKMDFTALN